jgi:DNA-binding NarL/FixJ family response regulator
MNWLMLLHQPVFYLAQADGRLKTLDKILVWLASNCGSTQSSQSTLLAGYPMFKCIGESNLSCDALERIEAAQPDVLVLDIDAHDRQTTWVLKRLARTIPHTRIIAHSATGDKRFVMRLLRQGVQGYVAQHEITTELAKAINAVMQGDVFLCPTASGALVSEYRKHARLRKRNDATHRASIHTHTEKGK